MIRVILHTIVFILLSLPAFSQVAELRDVINHYVAVTAVDSCEKMITVESAEGFAAGDRVLLIQMKGAIIDQDTSSERFGRMLDFGRAGTYHLGTIASIGRSIELIESVSRGFDVEGLVQLVRVPRYHQARVVDTLRPMKWNGRLGGIVALEVIDALWLDAPVDATGAGFRGGRMIVQAREDCSVPLRVQDINSSLSGGRGETYAYYDTVIAHGGRGRAAGGGGGGNSSNAGGGGGAGAGAGGHGGGQYTSCGPLDVSGEGGEKFATSELAERLFFGSGGGAGHANNAQGTSGAAGGGIAIIRAAHVYGNGQSIRSDGQSVRGLAGIDGAGGGGGGGSVLFEYDTLHSRIVLSAQGGAGGSGGGFNGCHGPGGGGGGGIVQIALERSPGPIEAFVDGGPSGTYTAANVPECVNTAYGSEPGLAGVVVGDVTSIEGHVGGVFSLSPIEGLPGDIVMITLSYDGALDCAFRPIQGVTTTIEFDSSLIALPGVSDQIRPGAVQMYRALSASQSTLVQYKAMLLLGSSGTTTLRIASVRPDLDVTPRYCQWNAVAVDALVTIQLCEEGDSRTVRLGQPTAVKVAVPNPAQGQSQVSFTVSEDGPITLSLIDALGVVRRTFFKGLSAPGEYTIPVDLRDVAPGRYVLQLVTRSESVTSFLVVQQ